MSKLIKLKSGSAFEEKASYSRAVAVDNWVYVSNTAGRHPVTRQIPEDFVEQALQVFENLEAALQAVGSCLADVVVSRVYIQNPEDIPLALDVIGATFRGVDPAMTVTCPPLGAHIYKIEIEVTAYRGASRMEADLRRING